MSADDRMDDRLLLESEVILAQNGKPFLGSDGDLALIGLQFPRKELQKGGFSRPVGADDAIAVPGREFEIDVLEKNLPAVAEGDIGYADHRPVPLREGARKEISNRLPAAVFEKARSRSRDMGMVDDRPVAA